MTMQNERYLFRGISTHTGTWVRGYLYRYSETRALHIIVSDPRNRGVFIYPSVSYPVIPETVGQFTGMLDCTGEKIFEGDKVRIDNFNPRFRNIPEDFDYRIFDIMWNKYVWAFYNDLIYYPMSPYDTHDGTEFHIVKIGSIHDKLITNIEVKEYMEK